MHWKMTPEGTARSKVRFAFFSIIDPKSRYKYWLEFVEIQQTYIAFDDGDGFWRTTRVLPIKVKI